MIYKRGCEMDDFLEMVEEELLHQKVLLKKSKQVLRKAAEGALRCRARKERTAIYWIKREGGRQQEVNISDQNDLIQALLDRKISEVTLAAAEKKHKGVTEIKRAISVQRFYGYHKRVVQELSRCRRCLGQRANSG